MKFKSCLYLEIFFNNLREDDCDKWDYLGILKIIIFLII